jgi:CTP synthase
MLLQEEFIFRLLKRERRVWKTVQVVHITNEIKDRMQLLGNSGDYDIVITEIGTVGHRILALYRVCSSNGVGLGEHNAIVIHLTLVPYLAAAGELKQNLHSIQ